MHIGQKGEKMDDLISRKATVKAIEQHKIAVLEGHKWDEGIEYGYAAAHRHLIDIIEQLPSVQPFYNITMTDVLKYIDNMPEEVWLEFTYCLECRGWELQRRTAKWCGDDFA